MEKITENHYRDRLLTLLDEFDVYCKDNQLKYYLACGSLLGAVRHQGFIPWDDDIDVCMPRDDYIKLIEHSQKKELPFDFYCYEKHKDYVHYYGKVSDKETIIKYKYISNSANYGIFIDVFPLDGFDDSVNINRIQKKLLRNIKFLKMCGMKKYWGSNNL